MTDSIIRMRAAEAADYIRVSRSTLTKWRREDGGPPWHRCGPRLVMYLKHEVDQWLARDHFPSGGSDS
jgi:predicted DNA-binding transcriptional regulator AlpA